MLPGLARFPASAATHGVQGDAVHICSVRGS
jgi:hypothetical protein